MNAVTHHDFHTHPMEMESLQAAILESIRSGGEYRIDFSNMPKFPSTEFISVALGDIISEHKICLDKFIRAVKVKTKTTAELDLLKYIVQCAETDRLRKQRTKEVVCYIKETTRGDHSKVVTRGNEID